MATRVALYEKVAVCCTNAWVQESGEVQKPGKMSWSVSWWVLEQQMPSAPIASELLSF